MSEGLLQFYQRELMYVRRLAGEFALAHPDDAAALRLGADRCDDPHVERLIEGFAYVAARLRQKLDDDFPEVTDALLNVLYPHYLAPVPAMSIVELELDRKQGGLTSGYEVSRGRSIESTATRTRCLFETCADVTLWPIEITGASLETTPDLGPNCEPPPGTQAVLRIRLQCFAPDQSFANMEIDTLRLFIRTLPHYAFGLYELLLKNAIAVGVRSAERSAAPVMLDRAVLKPAGFSRDERMLPQDARSFPGYRLLTEFFAFPEKFLFVDFTGLGNGVLQGVGRTMEILVFHDRVWKDLEQAVEQSTLRLGCTPVINIFPKTLEPVILSQTEHEYRLVPDVRNPDACDVYSITAVRSVSQERETVTYRPFYSLRHAEDRVKRRAFWYATRRPAEEAARRQSDDVFITFVDLNFDPRVPDERTVMVDALCHNGSLPSQLPFGGGQPVLRLEGGGPIGRTECLVKPRSVLRPPGRHLAVWKLVSHLSLNHLSIVCAAESADGVSTTAVESAHALREILLLYDHLASSGSEARISGIHRIAGRRVTRRVGGPNAGGFCRGIEVNVLFDADHYADNSLFLFASVLERFLALYCSINSFTALVAHQSLDSFLSRTASDGDRSMEPYHEWLPRAGERPLL